MHMFLRSKVLSGHKRAESDGTSDTVTEDDDTFHCEKVILQFHPDEKLLVGAMPTTSVER